MQAGEAADISRDADTDIPPQLELRHIRKEFPGCVANDDVSLKVLPGEIHALLGENGAGKSTLVKIVYGLLRADAGEILWQGEAVELASPAFARRLGIGMVFQHFLLFETLTVAENVALGLNYRGQMRELSQRILAVAETYGLSVDPSKAIHELSVSERQRVEIIRCLLQEPRLLIMDEPTSVLTPQEVETLFATLRRLAAEGRSILYISHKLDEIRTLCARATILRGGRAVGECDPRSETAERLAEMMIGTRVTALQRGDRETFGPEQLTVERLNVPSSGPFGTPVEDVSFGVRAGEIFGIAGVAGNGQRELLSALFGEIKLRSSDVIQCDGQPVGHLGPRQRRDLGMTFVPDERVGHGSVPEMSLAENALLTGYRRQDLVEHGVIRHRQVQGFAHSIIDAFRVVARGTRSQARSLSGGNLQKFIIGREMMQRPDVLIVASPTWGVDAGAAASIRQALIDLAREGAAVLIVSQDLDELLEISDRIAVMSRGHLSAPMATRDATPEILGLLMAGVERPEQQIAS